MEKKELVPCSFMDIEEEMRKYNPDFKKIDIKDIVRNPSSYKLFSTSLDDHFCILLRSQSKELVTLAKTFLKKSGFDVYGSIDRRGLDKVRDEYLKRNLPPSVVHETMKKTMEYLGVDLSKEKEIGCNLEKDYYFYFYPIKSDVRTWADFKKMTYLDELNVLAKKYASSIDLIFSQLDNVVYGGLKLPGIAIEKYHDAFFEACNVQVKKTDQRSLFIACSNLMELVSEEKELSEIGLFQMFMVEEEIFAEDRIEEIYLDFPNEITDDSDFRM